MNVLGITLGHDTSLSLVCDGKVVGTMEAERYFRQKRYKLHCLNMRPGRQLSGYQYVDLAELQLFLSFVGRQWGTTFDAVAVQNQGRTEEHKNLLSILHEAGFKFNQDQPVNHHLSHAALAFYTSPFDEAVVLSYDGAGNDGQTIIFKAGRAGLEYMVRNRIKFGQSYNNVGYIVGIKPDITGTTSGKLMGLAAYGTLREEWLPYARKYVREYAKLAPAPIDGLNAYGEGHRINSVGLNEIPELRQFLVKVESRGSGGLRKRTMDILSGRNAIPELRLPGPEDAMSQDLARTVQAAWTQEVLELLAPYGDGKNNLCITGGCALNGIANYEIQESGRFKDTAFVPNPTDCGLSAGAALYVYHRLAGKTVQGYGEYFTPYLGSEPFDHGDLQNLKGEYPHRELRPEETPGVLARLVHANRIVGVIRGRYEVGPRALGNRSILCTPLNGDMRDILNRKVKQREWYRPFAPVVIAEDAGKYFTNVKPIPYMSVICFTRPEYVGLLPAVTHVDGSARLQTIERAQNPFLYDVLREFEVLSGVPIMLNTSFNPRGEPILNFCAVGLEMLKTTELDLVLIDDTLFCRRGREELLA